MSGEASDEQVVQQIRAMVEAELQRRGRPGKPRVEGHFLVVGKGATAARADLKGSLQQWDSLPDDLRERRAQQIAQLLGEGAERAPVVRRQTRRRLFLPGLFSFVGPVIVLALMIAGLALAYQYLSPNKESALATANRWLNQRPIASVIASVTAPTYNASNIEQERAVIASTACSKSRARVARGGSVGPADVEGWRVQLVLLRRGPNVDLSQSAALGPFVRRAAGSKAGKLVWAKASSLVAEDRFDAQVELAVLPPLGEKNVSGISLVFSGPYVVPYFTEDQRSDYFLLADALADALGASDGALFAHCADSEAHHVGSWFLGATPGAAVASMIYFMESYSDFPVLKPEVLGNGTDQARRGHTFDAISQAASSLSRSSVATLVGGELGMISGRPNKPARLTFPFRDGNRASRSGLEAARSLGLASSR
ncbi:MAG: hypothetical protein WDO69_23720 [Pseudomonadota bacterium]